MPAITLGYSQIEQQIRLIRRRRNSVTVQQAVYLFGGVMLLGVALLIVLAVRGERLAFTVAFWLTLASVLVSAVAGVRSIWHRWIRAAETPRWIDRAAQLDDRLATLVAHQGTPQPPRLMATLVSQLFALRYRWEPGTLVPRRVPRSVYFFVAALTALIATSFIERPPATPQRFPHAKTTASRSNSAADAAGGPVVRIEGQKAGNGENPGDKEHGTQLDGPAGSRPGGSKRADGASRDQLRRSQKDGPGIQGEMQQGLAGEKAPPPLPNRVQDMIRQALDRPPVGQQARPGGEDRRQAQGGKPRDQNGNRGQQSQQHANAAGLTQRDQAQPRADAPTPPQSEHENAEGPRGNKGGAGGGQGTSGIYGGQPQGANKEAAAKTFALKLVLQGQSSRATMEPQKSKRGGVGDVGLPADQPATDAPLNPVQRADEPLVRAEIPVEHEAMVKRMFSRPE